MIPLDNADKWFPILDESARRYLSEPEYQKYQTIAEAEKSRQLRAMLEKPIARFSPVNEAYFRARWAEALRSAFTGENLSLLEIASGDADMIPQMMARAYPHSRYITANMNRILTERLREKTCDLPLEITVIEEDAKNINRSLPQQSVDIIAFQHGVNDVLQAILCDQAGIDTIYADWMETLPKMISILQREMAQDTFEQHVRPAFLGLLETLHQALKKNGLIIMNHYMFQLDLDWGYPETLFDNLIPIVREWIKALPGYEEVFFEGFHPHWWMFLHKP